MSGLSDAKKQTLLTLQRRALEWFERSLEQPDMQRDAWLDEHCTDRAVRARVRHLQQADTADDNFLDKPYSLMTAATRVSGSRVGAYCIDRLLAEGGMGSVYLAHRDDGVYQQQVAVKFLHPLWRHPDANRRFAAERQILAQLQHPNIAQMLDAGTSDDGVPYVVMEYVDGLPITEYCRQQQSSLKARLDLFRDVCSAVAAAHRALVVHRDLKPANILVTGDGRPMLLDFGIAKILATDVDAENGDRATTVMALTPAYASPEQIQRYPITTSSDIYSLGVLLYELLTGKRPYELDGLTPARSEQLICDTVPPLPSQMVAIEHVRNVSTSGPRLLRGDLDVIAMMALRKEPERRYGSAQALSEDVHRYLRGMPINARGDSTRYRLAKFSQRHRWGMVAAAGLMLSLIGGIMTTSWQMHHAQQQATRAEAAQTRAQHLNSFYKEILMSPSGQWMSSIGNGADVTMVDVLEHASRRADTELAGQPDVQVDVLATLSQAFQGMGLYVQAENTALRALKVAQAKLPAQHHLQVTSHYRLAQALYFKNDVARSEHEYLDAIALANQALPAADEMTALMHNDLSVLYRTTGRLEDAKRELSLALDLQRQRMHGKPNPAIAIGLNNLGVLRLGQGDLAGATEFFDQSLATHALLANREYAEKSYSYAYRSVVHSIRGQFTAAESDARAAVDIAGRKLGHSHPRYARTLVLHAETMIDLGRVDGVARSLQQAEDVLNKKLVPTHLTQAKLAIAQARWAMQQQHYTRAAQLLGNAQKIVDAQPVTSASDRPNRMQGRILALLGEVRLAQGNRAEAEKLLTRGVAIESALYGPDEYEVRHFSDLLASSRSTNQATAVH